MVYYTYIYLLCSFRFKFMYLHTLLFCPINGIILLERRVLDIQYIKNAMHTTTIYNYILSKQQ
jgi:hypothetical protein